MKINPNIHSRKQKPLKPLQYYADGINKGDRFVLSEAITLIESSIPVKRSLGLSVLEATYKESKDSVRIGISGSPGAGKSTFLNVMGNLLSTKEKKVAILAVDPSSQQSKGSILGDKTRMENIVSAADIYIRPTPAGNNLGGTALYTKETIQLCENAGFNTIFIETVGVGQSEIEVSSMVDVFCLLILPGSGDDIQGIKRGITEMADIVIINKADGDRIALANQSKKLYQNGMYLLRNKLSDWKPKILTSSSTENIGIDEIWETILEFVKTSKACDYFFQNRKAQDQSWFDKKSRDLALNYYLRNNNQLQSVLELRAKIISGDINAFSAIKTLLHTFT